MMRRKIVVGTRGSKLALWQAHHIAGLIEERHPGIQADLVRISTTGDKILDVPLAKVGGKGLFTKEIEVGILNGDIDIAVHSLKDMPAELPAGLTLAAITRREDPGDALISPRYKTLENLPAGARIGTSSLRRQAQLRRLRPDLQAFNLRGNLDTRLSKLDAGDLDGIMLAVSGLKRLGWAERITQVMPIEDFLPAVGQGALAIEARTEDAEILELIETLNDPETRDAVEAERAFLREIEGGCQIPVGVYAQIEDEMLRLDAVILNLDGTAEVRGSVDGRRHEANTVGRDLAQRLLKAGGAEILRCVM